MDKIIPVEKDNKKEAIEEVKREFLENELSSEWLDNRSVNFSEVDFINTMGGYAAEDLYYKYKDKIKYSTVKKFIFTHFGSEIREFLLAETIKSLDKKYNIRFNQVSYSEKKKEINEKISI